jgi:hypothetical protein
MLSSGNFLRSITQVIKVNSHGMDSYYATDVNCCKRIYIYRVSIDLYSNILIKLITSGYDLKDIKLWTYKKYKNFESAIYFDAG